MSGINKRNFPGNEVQDPSAIDMLTYNDMSGSRKVSEVGRSLIPLGNGAAAFTTDASTARILPGLGINLAIYNNSGSVGSVTFGTSNAQVSLAPGATNATGQVGIPCMPNAWTYVAANQYQWVITSDSTLLTFIIADNTTIKKESNCVAST